MFRRTLPLFILAGFTFTLAIIRYSSLKPVYNDSASPSIQPSVLESQIKAKPEIVSYVLPKRLKIPKLDIDVRIEHVGLTKGGDMEAPSSNWKVGWYKFGSHPGNSGSAVIAGHYGRWGNAVFGDLDELKKGDKVYVEDEKGAISIFVVRASRSFEPSIDTPEVFNSNDGKPYLNLITCEDVWDEAAQSFSKRLVVFADQSID